MASARQTSTLNRASHARHVEELLLPTICVPRKIRAQNWSTILRRMWLIFVIVGDVRTIGEDVLDLKLLQSVQKWCGYVARACRRPIFPTKIANNRWFDGILYK
jgi:hypothetical protein